MRTSALIQIACISTSQVAPEDYLAAKPDPVAAFSAPVCGHMNGDHEQDMKDMVKHYVGLTVATVKMLDVDRLGTNMQCTTETNPEPFKLRLPFIR